MVTIVRPKFFFDPLHPPARVGDSSREGVVVRTAHADLISVQIFCLAVFSAGRALLLPNQGAADGQRKKQRHTWFG